MGFFKFILAVLPFFRDLLTNNKDMNRLVDTHKSTTGLLFINIFLFVLYLYAFNEARDRDFVIAEAIYREKRLEEKITSLDLYYTKKLEDRETLFAERLGVKDQEVDYYKRLVADSETRSKRCSR